METTGTSAEKASQQRDITLPPLKIIIAAAGLQTRDSLERMIRGDSRFAITDIVSTGGQLIEAAKKNAASIGIVDVPLPDLTARGVLFALKQERSDLQVILRARLSEEALWRLVKLGLRGLLPADKEQDSLRDIISTVADGMLALPYVDTDLLLSNSFNILSRPERELLFAVSNQWTNSQIALRLNISEKSVQHHINCLYDKLGATNRKSALAMFRLHRKKTADPNQGPKSVDGPVSADIATDRRLLIVDDDHIYRSRLATAMEHRGFDCLLAQTVAEAIALIAKDPPAFALVDMRFETRSGLEVIAALASARPDARCVVLTGFGSIANAVSAMKLGAFDYLSKSSEPDEIAGVLLSSTTSLAPRSERFMSVARMKWEYVQCAHRYCNQNTSGTARRIALHRRGLQRIKRAPK